MEIAKISDNGQITIPFDIRRKLKLKEGDKVAFNEQNGKFYVENASLLAFSQIQAAFADDENNPELQNENDVVKMCKQIRHDRWNEKYGKM